MDYAALVKLAQTSGFAFVIAVLAIFAVIRYFAKIEPRLKSIEDNQKDDAERNAVTAKVVENNTKAMADMAHSNDNVAEALRLVNTQLDANIKSFDKLWAYVLDKKDEGGRHGI